LFLGLMSGTSFDAIDAAVIALPEGGSPRLLGGLEQPLSDELRQSLEQLRVANVSLDQLAETDTAFGLAFSAAALACLQQLGLSPDSIDAVGSHGQTIWHRPSPTHANTLQIGNPNIIAEQLRRPVIADFRRADMAAGGQGAPLAPAFHQAIFSSTVEDRAVLNLGGIANLSLLPQGMHTEALGFDTGPANGLLDEWAMHCLGTACDLDGQLAGAGLCDGELLQRWLAHPYFQQPAPKSTGREEFTLPRLDPDPRQLSSSQADIAATLMALTVESIVFALLTEAKGGFDCQQLIAMGGGVRNPVLMQQLDEALGRIRLSRAEDHGWDSGLIEAAAFAWLAARRIDGLPGNLASVTGAQGPRLLGAIYPG
jgi:anhydro-N-acetylmuramic acid kinase